MREIRFRAWDKSKNKMCEVDFIKFSKVQYTQISFSNIEENKIIYQDSSLLDENMFGTCVLMQYTGLKDKNCVEIYEGDIIENYFKNKKQTLVCKWKYEGFVFEDLKDNQERFITKGIVIGNIYDNAELLEEK